MSESGQPEEQQPEPAKRGMVGLIIWAFVGLVSAATGFAGPIVFLATTREPASVDPIATPPAFVSMGSTVVNLDEGRLNRYLRISITLQVNEIDKADVEKAVTEKTSILKSWLLSYLADKTMDDIRGRSGQNRLRREIQDYVNSALFDDGQERVTDILFEEFNVQ